VGQFISRLGLSVGLVLIFITVGQGENMMIETGKKVKLDYTLTVGGEVIDTSIGKEPLAYTSGDGTIIPGLDSQMRGLQIGEERTVFVEPKDAYGEVDPKAFRELPKSFFPQGFEPQNGMVLEMKAEDGSVFPASIREVKDSTVVLDFNHPLAGQTLQFDVKIVAVE